MVTESREGVARRLTFPVSVIIPFAVCTLIWPAWSIEKTFLSKGQLIAKN